MSLSLKVNGQGNSNSGKEKSRSNSLGENYDDLSHEPGFLLGFSVQFGGDC